MNTMFTNWHTPFTNAIGATPWQSGHNWGGGCPVIHGQHGSAFNSYGYGPSGWWFGPNSSPANTFSSPFAFGHQVPGNTWNPGNWNTSGWNTGTWNSNVPAAHTPWFGGSNPTWANSFNPGWFNTPNPSTTPWNPYFQHQSTFPGNTVPGFFNGYNPTPGFSGFHPGTTTYPNAFGWNTPFGMTNGAGTTPWNTGSIFNQPSPYTNNPYFGYPNSNPNSNPNYNPGYNPNYNQNYNQNVGPNSMPGNTNVPTTTFGYANSYSTPFNNCTNTPATCAGREAA